MTPLSNALPAGLTESVAHALRGSEAVSRDLALDLVAETSTLLENDQRVAELLESRARVHANGFLKLTLVAPDEWATPALNGHKLVLHAWDDSVPAGTENVHDHRWPFWSTLMCGQLRWEGYSLSADSGVAPSHLEYEYRSPGTADSYEMLPRRRVALDRGFIAMMSAGTVFHLTEFELHKVARIDSVLSATLFLQGCPARTSTNVYIPVTDGRTGPIEAVAQETIKEEVTYLPVDAVRQLIKRLLD